MYNELVQVIIACIICLDRRQENRFSPRIISGLGQNMNWTLLMCKSGTLLLDVSMLVR